MSDKPKYKVYESNISEFKPDSENANNHTLRGRSVVHKGMQRGGYARPAFAAKDGTVLGGNLSTLDVAVDIGLGEGKVLVVETDGRLPIIHKRVDVEPGTEEARLLALEDNRSAEISLDWNPEVLVGFIESGLDLLELWQPEELSVILEEMAGSLAPTERANDPNAEWAGMPGFESEHKLGVKVIFVHFETWEDVTKFSNLVEQVITKETKYIWFPKREKNDLKGLVYSDES
jgi:hypothetical protein